MRKGSEDVKFEALEKQQGREVVSPHCFEWWWARQRPGVWCYGCYGPLYGAETDASWRAADQRCFHLKLCGGNGCLLEASAFSGIRGIRNHPLCEQHGGCGMETLEGLLWSSLCLSCLRVGRGVFWRSFLYCTDAGTSGSEKHPVPQPVKRWLKQGIFCDILPEKSLKTSESFFEDCVLCASLEYHEMKTWICMHVIWCDVIELNWIECNLMQCMFVCMHVCMYVCMYVYMYTCIHVCMFDQWTDKWINTYVISKRKQIDRWISWCTYFW